jgi:hypothetical protein
MPALMTTARTAARTAAPSHRHRRRTENHGGDERAQQQFSHGGSLPFLFRWPHAIDEGGFTLVQGINGNSIS